MHENISKFLARGLVLTETELKPGMLATFVQALLENSLPFELTLQSGVAFPLQPTKLRQWPISTAAHLHGLARTTGLKEGCLRVYCERQSSILLLTRTVVGLNDARMVSVRGMFIQFQDYFGTVNHGSIKIPHARAGCRKKEPCRSPLLSGTHLCVQR